MAPADNGSDQTAAADPSQGGEVPLIIRAQYIKDLSFENPGAPQIFANVDQEPDVDINVNVDANKLNNGDFEVVLTLKADAKAKGAQIFLAELAYAGVFAIGAGVPEEHHGPILLIECPRLLFPFARNILADATRDGGFPPLMLQPIDFMQIFQEQHGGAQPANA